MKRLTALLCAVTLTAVLLCGCDEKEQNKVENEIATFATEVMENVDSMVENGKVDDGDGYIDEERDEERSDATDAPLDDVTDEADDGEGLFDVDDPTEEEMI